MPSDELRSDPIRAASELREQLSSHARRLGFFIGSGASMAVGLPGIDQLTIQVKAEFQGQLLDQYEMLLQGCGPNATVEDVLNKVRLIQEFLGNDGAKAVDGINNDAAKELDNKICSAINKILSADPPKGLQPHLRLAAWIRHIQREQPVEIFTTNYDLLLENALEQTNVPYFDGFVGSVSPFFVQDSVEADGGEKTKNMYPPTSWTRLWKVHGSIGWRMNEIDGKKRITRVLNSPEGGSGDLMIHPSRYKYVDSRKLPFMTYLDRLRKFLSSGECLLVVIGYSFRDEHLNATIYDALRSNNRLAVTVLLYESPPPELLTCAGEFRNLSVLDPSTACIGGIQDKWNDSSTACLNSGQTAIWDTTTKNFKLGDFSQFAAYLNESFNELRTSTSNVTQHTSGKEA